MKYAVLGVVGVLIAGGALWYVRSAFMGPERPETSCAQVVTTAKNPQTGEVQTFSTPCDVPPEWQLIEGNGNDSYQENNAVMQRFRNEEYGFAFAYRQEPEGYTLIELPKSGTDGVGLRAAYTLMDTEEYGALQGSADAREGPPAIVFQVYQNQVQESVAGWLEAHPTLANYHLKSSSLRDEEIGGIPAVRYSFDGLYQNEAIVVNHRGYIIVFMGAFTSFEDPIRREFLNIVSSMAFF
ncbi:MAG: hypothetical protein KBE09_03645 [Candidatus Pacebacteria bacterium]|nr:hypothetical protein [Candidatus Paceibacterota bacterium]